MTTGEMTVTKRKKKMRNVSLIGQPYLPLPMEGNAIDFSFFSSAMAKQFFTVFSNNSSHLSAPQLGLLQWITNLAGNPWPALTAAVWGQGEEKEANIGYLRF